jgi:hypothetical protein
MQMILVDMLCKLRGSAWWELFQTKLFASKANFKLKKEITQQGRKYLT